MVNWKRIWNSKLIHQLADKSSSLQELAALLSAELNETVTVAGLTSGRKRLIKQGVNLPKFADLLAKDTISTTISSEILKQHKIRQQERETKEELKKVLKELNAADERLNILLGVKDKHIDAKPIKPKAKTIKKLEATAVALASDWHVEENVDQRAVNGRNAYNPKIAEERAQKFFDGVEWLIKHHKNSIDIENLILWFGGDLISGYIHEELQESNHMSPTEAILFVKELLSRGIKQLLTVIDNLIIPCSLGNHGRTLPKRRISTNQKNSFEWLLYKVMEQEFANEPRVTFIVPDGDHVYLDVYKWTMRFTHGDNFSYGGGTGGLSVPLQRGVARLQTFKHADVTCIGHFHQLKDFGDIVVNGSSIGYNPYAMSINAAYEPPQQAFFLMEREHGKSMFTPVWLT